jgi:hypothetical protein
VDFSESAVGNTIHRERNRDTERERERTTQGGRQQRYAISMGRVTINDGGRGAWRQQGNSSNGDS